MKTFTSIAVLFLFTISVYAQKDMEDVVYLKNGSQVHGTILQLFPDSIVQIKQVGGSVWIFPMKDVSMIAKEEKIRYKATIIDGRGYQFGMDAGVLIGAGNNENKAPFGVHVLNTYRFKAPFSVGVGAGLEFFRTTHIPLYLDARWYVNRKYYAPYLFMQGGTMIPIGKQLSYNDGYEFKGQPGYMLNPGIGFLFPLSEKSVFSISFSYRYHELLYERENGNITDYTLIERMNRFNLRFGFVLR